MIQYIDALDCLDVQNATHEELIGMLSVSVRLDRTRRKRVAKRAPRKKSSKVEVLCNLWCEANALARGHTDVLKLIEEKIGRLVALEVCAKRNVNTETPGAAQP